MYVIVSTLQKQDFFAIPHGIYIKFICIKCTYFQIIKWCAGIITNKSCNFSNLQMILLYLVLWHPVRIFGLWHPQLQLLLILQLSVFCTFVLALYSNKNGTVVGTYYHMSIYIFLVIDLSQWSPIGYWKFLSSLMRKRTYDLWLTHMIE